MNVRCGIVGYGRIGKLFHEVLSDPDEPIGLDVVAAVDTAPGKVVDLADRLIALSDYGELLKFDVDAILIATPPRTHFQLGRDALLAGKHVLLEKPPTHTSSECQELIATSRERQRGLFYAFHARYNEAVEFARSRLAGREVREVRATYREDVLHFHAPDSWVHQEGALWDTGINAISVITYVLPPAAEVRVEAASLHRPPGCRGETLAQVHFAVGSRGRGILDVDCRYPGPETREILITTDVSELKIDITFDALYENGIRVTRDESRQTGLRQEYCRMLRHFREVLSRCGSLCSCAEVSLVEAAHRFATSRA